MSGLRVELPPEVVAALVEQVAAVVLERLSEQASTVERSEYLTVAEAADVLRAKPQRVYDLLSARRLPKHHDGTRVLVRRADLDEYLANGNGNGCRRVDPPMIRPSRGRTGKGDVT